MPVENQIKIIRNLYYIIINKLLIKSNRKHINQKSRF